MSQWSEHEKPASAEDLSALMDGELDTSAMARACGRWREDREARAQWHAYHLIGDVLRSEDLASSAARDADFLASLRVRLADEPVVLAPSNPAVQVPAEDPRRQRRSWATPVAVAAGFVVVAGTLAVTQMAGGLSPRGLSSDAAVTAGAGAPPTVVIAFDAASAVEDPPSVVLNGRLVRDVRLDEYLAAHKRFGGSSLPGGPSGFLRNAAADGTAR
ncbi:MAG: sigma-E factor negative regulatory protein [Rhizobacter sp.]|nr:sigma-E factor negative regulatory protein [Rhizobacter sp.]